MLFPAVRTARESASQSQWTANFKQIELAPHSYLMAKGTFPPGVRGLSDTLRVLPDRNNPSIGSLAFLLPGVEELKLKTKCG